MKHSMFESMGGFARVRLLVADFYDRILDSERLAPYFAHVDMRRLVDHQTKFMATIMGGPASYSDDQLARAHAGHHITPEAFDEMADLFRETLEDFDIAHSDVDRLLAHVVGLRDHVVARPGARA